MPLEGDVSKGRATRHLLPPRSKRARDNGRKHVSPMITSTNTTEGGSRGVGSWTSLGSRSHVMRSLTPTQVLSDSGGRNPPASPADRVFDLSSELGMLRSRSAEVVRTLRSTAKGDRELEEALLPVFIALDSGIAECHQADLEAIFGRSATPRGTLGLQRGGSRGGCGSAGGGTIAATENLDGLIAALHCNVAIAGMLADQGERLRIISRWARLVRSRTTAQRPMTKDSRRNVGGTLDGDAMCESQDGRSIDGLRSSLDDYSKMLRVFRQSVHHVDRYDKSDADSGLGGRDRSIRPGPGESVRTPSGRRVGINGPQREWGGFPIVTFHALREVLPEMEPQAKAKTESTVPGSVVMRNGTSTPSCSMPNNARGSWRFLYSWLIGSGKRDSGLGELARPETPSLPPTPKTALPRITLNVIYNGRVSDMAMLARAEERALAAEDKGEPISSASPMLVGVTDSGVPPRSTRNGFKAGSVELVRSEVRVIAAIDQEKAAAVGRGTDALGAEAGVEPGLLSNTALKLQIALQLRTRSPVAVSRMIHRGGHLLLKKPPAAEGVGRSGGGRGFSDEGVDGDVFPTGFRDAPEELLLPKRLIVGDDKSELKIGTDHFLGMNVVLPPDEHISSNDGVRPRSHRRPGVNTPSYKRKLREPVREGLGNSSDIRGLGGDTSHGDREGGRSIGKKRPRPDDGIGSLCREGRAVGLDIGVNGSRGVLQYGDSGSSNLLPVRERTVLDIDGRSGMATDALGANDADRGQEYGCESVREAKRRKIYARGKGWSWGVFRPWGAEASAVRDGSAARLALPSRDQGQSVDQDIEGRHINIKLGEGDQSRRRESVLTSRNGVRDNRRDANVDLQLSNAGGTTNNGAVISGDRERPEKGACYSLSGGKRAPLIVTVVLTPPCAEIL